MATETTISRPAPFVEDIGKDLAKQAVALTGVPVVSTGIAGLSQQPGETAEGFKARQDAARAFTTRQQNLAGLAPQVAAQDRLQKEAQKRAEAGLGSFQPFLDQAQIASAASFSPQIAQQFMSPYQQQVIDTTLADFDRQAAMGRQGIRDQAATAGAFGGGREGVQMAEYDAGNLRNRASLLAQLQQQGFTQAQNLAQQAFQNQGNLAAQQMGLSNFQRGSMGQDVAALGNLGAFRQGLTQSQLAADQAAARTAAFEPQQRLQQFGAGLSGLAGFGGVAPQIPQGGSSPLATALSTATGLAGIFGKLYGS